MGKKSENATETVRAEIERLRPTQLACGWQEVEAKQWEILGLRREKLEGWLKKRPIPAVAGPDGKLYMVDRHHMGLALTRLAERWDWEHRRKEGGENPYALCHVKVVRDLSDVDLTKTEFFEALEELGMLHPFDENGARVGVDAIPKTVADLRDDPFRALAGFARKAGAFEKSAEPYAEFKWADKFREKIGAEEIRKDLQGALGKALGWAASPEFKGLPGWTGVPGLGLDAVDVGDVSEELAKAAGEFMAKKTSPRVNR